MLPTQSIQRAQMIERIRQEELEDLISRPNQEGLSLITDPRDAAQDFDAAPKNTVVPELQVCIAAMNPCNNSLCKTCAA